jgi:chemotaxis protein methyltransferase CheR
VSMEEKEFGYVRDLIHRRAGLILESGKEYLVEYRLLPLARREGAESVSELIKRLRASAPCALHECVVEAMTTSETSFFRDLHPFLVFRDSILPALTRKRRDSLMIWSAACATGQEPYTIAMIIKEHSAQLGDCKVRILASDISTEVLKRARAGRFSQLEVNRGLPAQLMVKYFRRDGDDWVIRPDIRTMVEFQQINLVHPFPVLPRMDAILLRNVLLYFDVATKRRILAAMRGQLKRDGFLLLGGTETALGIDENLERVTNDRGGWHRLRSGQ